MKLTSYIAALAWTISLFLVQPCSGQTGPGTLAPTTNVKASDNYVLVPLDVVHFRVIGEPETETEVRVASDGSINLPYIGSRTVGGMSVSQAREYLYGEYAKDYYVNPQIDMVIVAYKQNRVNVQGMVNRQGFVVFPPEETMTLMGAIAMAGGWGDNRLADRRHVKLIRTDASGNANTVEIDTTKISQSDWPLNDGDLIVVPEVKW